MCVQEKRSFFDGRRVVVLLIVGSGCRLGRGGGFVRRSTRLCGRSGRCGYKEPAGKRLGVEPAFQFGVELVDVGKGGPDRAPADKLPGELAEGGIDAGGFADGRQAGFEVEDVVEREAVGPLEVFERQAHVWSGKQSVGEGGRSGDGLQEGGVDDVSVVGRFEQQAEFDLAAVGCDKDERVGGHRIEHLSYTFDFDAAGAFAEEAGDEGGVGGQGDMASGVGFEVEGDVEHQLHEDDQAEGPAAAQRGGPEQAVGVLAGAGAGDEVGHVVDFHGR